MALRLQDPLVGQVVDGRYEVLSRIAAGGMATVYLAADARLGRQVALKVMHPHLAADEVFVDRFAREARSAAGLSHPGIVGVYDQGAEGSTVYLAMEHVPGRTLRDVLTERGALSPGEALAVVGALLDALAAHHEAAGITLTTEQFRTARVEPGDGGTVTFSSGTTLDLDGATPILDAAEGAGMLMPSGCRMGIWMGCVIPLREGSVRDLRNGAITTAVPGETGDIKVQTCINAAAGPCHIDH